MAGDEPDRTAAAAAAAVRESRVLAQEQMRARIRAMREAKQQEQASAAAAAAAATTTSTPAAAAAAVGDVSLESANGGRAAPAAAAAAAHAKRAVVGLGLGEALLAPPSAVAGGFVAGNHGRGGGGGGGGVDVRHLTWYAADEDGGEEDESTVHGHGHGHAHGLGSPPLPCARTTGGGGGGGSGSAGDGSVGQPTVAGGPSSRQPDGGGAVLPPRHLLDVSARAPRRSSSERDDDGDDAASPSLASGHAEGEYDYDAGATTSSSYSPRSSGLASERWSVASSAAASGATDVGTASRPRGGSGSRRPTATVGSGGGAQGGTSPSASASSLARYAMGEGRGETGAPHASAAAAAAAADAGVLEDLEADLRARRALSSPRTAAPHSPAPATAANAASPESSSHTSTYAPSRSCGGGGGGGGGWTPISPRSSLSSGGRTFQSPRASLVSLASSAGAYAAARNAAALAAGGGGGAAGGNGAAAYAPSPPLSAPPDEPLPAPPPRSPTSSSSPSVASSGRRAGGGGGGGGASATPATLGGGLGRRGVSPWRESLSSVASSAGGRSDAGGVSVYSASIRSRRPSDHRVSTSSHYSSGSASFPGAAASPSASRRGSSSADVSAAAGANGARASTSPSSVFATSDAGFLEGKARHAPRRPRRRSGDTATHSAGGGGRRAEDDVYGSADEEVLGQRGETRGPAGSDDEDALSDVLHLSVPPASTFFQAMMPALRRGSTTSAETGGGGGSGGSGAEEASRTWGGTAPPTPSTATSSTDATTAAAPAAFGGPRRGSSFSAEEEERRRRSLMHKSLGGLVAVLDQEADLWRRRSIDDEHQDTSASISAAGVGTDEPARRKGATTALSPPSSYDVDRLGGPRDRRGTSSELGAAAEWRTSTASGIVGMYASSDFSHSNAHASSSSASEDERRVADAERTGTAAPKPDAATVPAASGSDWTEERVARSHQTSLSVSTVQTNVTTTPTIAIEDVTEGGGGGGDGGGGVASSEEDSDFLSEEDGPRKRRKQKGRKNKGRPAWGFDEQRATLSRPPGQTASRSTANLSGLAPPVSPSAAAGSVGSSSASSSPSLPSSTSSSSSSLQSPQSGNPWAFYEFSPDLPPFVTPGLKPMDLTGRGTWRAIAARGLNPAGGGVGVGGVPTSTLSSRASTSTLGAQSDAGSMYSSASTVGPVSMREVAAQARANLERAHSARQRQHELLSQRSFRPVDIHTHASRFGEALAVVEGNRQTLASPSSVWSFDSSMALRDPPPPPPLPGQAASSLDLEALEELDAVGAVPYRAADAMARTVSMSSVASRASSLGSVRAPLHGGEPVPPLPSPSSRTMSEAGTDTHAERREAAAAAASPSSQNATSGKQYAVMATQTSPSSSAEGTPRNSPKLKAAAVGPDGDDDDVEGVNDGGARHAGSLVAHGSDSKGRKREVSMLGDGVAGSAGLVRPQLVWSDDEDAAGAGEARPSTPTQSQRWGGGRKPMPLINSSTAATTTTPTERRGEARRGAPRRVGSAPRVGQDSDPEDAMVWPPVKLRAPRLSGRKSSSAMLRRRATMARLGGGGGEQGDVSESTVALTSDDETTTAAAAATTTAEDSDSTASADEDEASDESDLDLATPLKLLAERSGALDPSRQALRGSKRKLRQAGKRGGGSGTGADGVAAMTAADAPRRIAPAPRTRVSQAMGPVRTRQGTAAATASMAAARGVWSSSSDDEDDHQGRSASGLRSGAGCSTTKTTTRPPQLGQVPSTPASTRGGRVQAPRPSAPATVGRTTGLRAALPTARGPAPSALGGAATTPRAVRRSASAATLHAKKPSLSLVAITGRGGVAGLFGGVDDDAESILASEIDLPELEDADFLPSPRVAAAKKQQRQQEIGQRLQKDQQQQQQLETKSPLTFPAPPKRHSPLASAGNVEPKVDEATIADTSMVGKSLASESAQTPETGAAPFEQAKQDEGEQPSSGTSQTLGIPASAQAQSSASPSIPPEAKIPPSPRSHVSQTSSGEDEGSPHGIGGSSTVENTPSTLLGSEMWSHSEGRDSVATTVSASSGGSQGSQRPEDEGYRSAKSSATSNGAGEADVASSEATHKDVKLDAASTVSEADVRSPDAAVTLASTRSGPTAGPLETTGSSMATTKREEPTEPARPAPQRNPSALPRSSLPRARTGTGIPTPRKSMTSLTSTAGSAVLPSSPVASGKTLTAKSPPTGASSIEASRSPPSATSKAGTPPASASAAGAATSKLPITPGLRRRKSAGDIQAPSAASRVPPLETMPKLAGRVARQHDGTAPNHAKQGSGGSGSGGSASTGTVSPTTSTVASPPPGAMSGIPRSKTPTRTASAARAGVTGAGGAATPTPTVSRLPSLSHLPRRSVASHGGGA